MTYFTRWKIKALLLQFNDDPGRIPGKETHLCSSSRWWRGCRRRAWRHPTEPCLVAELVMSSLCLSGGWLAEPVLPFSTCSGNLGEVTDLVWFGCSFMLWAVSTQFHFSFCQPHLLLLCPPGHSTQKSSWTEKLKDFKTYFLTPLPTGIQKKTSSCIYLADQILIPSTSLTFLF